MFKKDVTDRDDIKNIIERFYKVMLQDPIVGFIFTDVAKIHLQSHLPIIVDFWTDGLFNENNYKGNTLLKHIELHQKMPLRPGHFTRWLYLFEQAVNEHHSGANATAMLRRAESVAKSISAALVKSKRNKMELVLPKNE